MARIRSMSSGWRCDSEGTSTTKPGTEGSVPLSATVASSMAMNRSSRFVSSVIALSKALAMRSCTSRYTAT